MTPHRHCYAVTVTRTGNTGAGTRDHRGDERAHDVAARATSPLPDPVAIGALARAALLAELHADPKPGLVGPFGPGSHSDMDRSHFERSAAALEPFFVQLAGLGATAAPMDVLRRVGLDAETAMLAATGGVNTHRGAIFGLGLLCAAAGAVDRDPGPAPASAGRASNRTGSAGCDPTRSGSPADRPRPDHAIPPGLGAIVATCWGSAIRSGPIPSHSHGTAVLRRHGVGGARAEAAAGFPTLYRVGLPALRAGRRFRPADPVAARVHCLFALLAAVDDTNLLHRGGIAGAAFARACARRFLAVGGVSAPDWHARARAVHHAFVNRRLSPGGCADLLAMTIFLDRFGEPASADPS